MTPISPSVVQRRLRAVIALVADDFGFTRRRIDATVLPLTKPTSVSRCSIHVKTASCVSRSISQAIARSAF